MFRVLSDPSLNVEHCVLEVKDGAVRSETNALIRLEEFDNAATLTIEEEERSLCLDVASEASPVKCAGRIWRGSNVAQMMNVPAFVPPSADVEIDGEGEGATVSEVGMGVPVGAGLTEGFKE